MFKVDNRNNRRRSGVFIGNFEYIWRFFADFEQVTAGWNTLLSQSEFIYMFQGQI